MKAVLPLNGGIDKDTNGLYIADGDVLKRENARVLSSDGGRGGINTSIKGMTQLGYEYPIDGNNTEIGVVEDPEREQLIIFVYNSLGNHGIFKLKDDSITELTVMIDLDFNINNPIDATVLGDYVYFTDGLNPPRKLNVVTPTTFSQTKDGLQVAMRHPVDAPVITIGTDQTKKVNKLVDKSFQFATYFVYQDDSYSVLSPYSKVAVSSAIFSADDSTYVDDTIGNFVSVNYNTGNNDVKTVVLLAREGNKGGWFIVDEFSGEGDERTISFYNDVAREFLPIGKALSLYSDVPLTANSNVAVKNRIGYGGIVKGYDKTEMPFTLDVEYESVDVAGSSTNLASSFNDGTETDTYYVEFTIPTGLSVGDSVVLDFGGSFQQGAPDVFFLWAHAFSHTVTQSDADTGDIQNAVAQRFAGSVISEDIITIVYNGDVWAWDIGAINTGSGVVRISFVGVYDSSLPTPLTNVGGTFVSNELPTGVATYKAGSYYNVGWLWYDDRSRTSGVLNPTKIYIPTNGERDYADKDKRARITFTMPTNVDVPSWATRGRFAVTESINFTGVFPFVTGNDTETNIRDILIDGKEVLAINMPTNLNYQFVNGDYLQIEVDTGSIQTITKTIIGTRVLIEDGGTDYSGFWLIVPKGTQAISDYDGVKCMIHRPKDEVSELIYFEDYTTYGTSVSELTGYVGDGDAWFTERTFKWGTDPSATESPVVEDFYLSIDGGVRAYSKGRAVVEFDTSGQIELQDFAWSEAYLDNTAVNGTSFFSPSNRKQLDEKDGAIRRVLLVGDVLKVVQDNKETSLYVGKGQFRDGSGNLTTVQVGDFIGDIYPSVDDYGSRFHDSIIKHNRNLYYWDGDKGEVVRSSPNGQISISDYRMKSEFLRIKASADAASSVKVVAHFDDRNDEFVITFSIDGNAETLAFKEGDNRWVSYYEYTDASGEAPKAFGSIGAQVYSFLDGGWKHEANTSHNMFYGSYKPFLIQGVINTPPTEEKALRALELDSNRGLKTTITAPVTNTAPLGIKSYLYADTYRERDGRFTSGVFKNVNTPSGENLSLIHSGRDCIGQYIELEFEDASSDECQLRMVTATFTVNK